MLSFDEFRKMLAEELMVEEDRVVPEASFLNDLFADSIRMVELMLRMQEELGVNIPPEATWKIQTVGDAYDYYLNHVSASA